MAPALSVLHRFASQTPIKEEVALPRIVRTTVWVPESPPSRDPNATPLMEEVQKSGGTENFDTSPWQREPPPGLDRTPTYEETRNPAWEAYHRARIQKALAPELHEAQHKLWAHFFDEHALQEGCPAAAAAWLSRLRALLRGAPRRPLINTCTKNFFACGAWRQPTNL